MKKKLPFNISPSNDIIVFVKNKAITVGRKTHLFYNKILDILLNDSDTVENKEEEIHSLSSYKIDQVVQKYYGDRVQIMDDDTITFDGEVITDKTFTDRLIWMMKNGADPTSLIKFFEKVRENVEKSSRESLFEFLTFNNLPITKDGNFKAYKAVRLDYYDAHSGTILNSVGSVISMPREDVTLDRNITCSSGLHVGAEEYVFKYFGGAGNTKRVMVVEVDPRDVVSVPHDYNSQKMRVCRYTVVGELLDKNRKLPEFNEEDSREKRASMLRDDEGKFVANNVQTISNAEKPKPLRDAKGRFIKRNDSSSVPSKTGPLRDAKGRFVKRS